MKMSVSSDIPRAVSDILIDLDVIAGIPSGCKLNVKTGTYVSATSWIGAGYRSWKGEECNGTIDYINDRISESILIAKKHPQWKMVICQKVGLLSDALINLKHTYSLDPRKTKKVSRFDLISLRISKEAFLNACEDVVTIENPLTKIDLK